MIDGTRISARFRAVPRWFPGLGSIAEAAFTFYLAILSSGGD